MRTRTKKACQSGIANKKPKGQLLGRATHCSSTGSSLKHNNFNNKKLPEHVLPMLLLTSATRPVINNKLVETKKRELTWWERVSPDETCMRVRERRV